MPDFLPFWLCSGLSLRALPRGAGTHGHVHSLRRLKMHVIVHPSRPCAGTHGVRNRSFPINTSLSLFVHQLALPSLWVRDNPHIQTWALTSSLQSWS